MFPITNQTVIGAVRSAALFAWVYITGWLLSLDAVADLEGIGELLNSIGGALTGPGVIVISGLLWAAITWLAKRDGIVGTIFQYAFGFPAQPTYDVPDDGSVAG